MLDDIELIWNTRLTPNERRTFSIPVTDLHMTGIINYGNYCGPGNRNLPPIDALDQACMFHDYYYSSKYSDERFILTLRVLCNNGLIRNKMIENIILNSSLMLKFILKARRLFPSSKEIHDSIIRR